jgi:hypothetical protein
MKKLLMIVVVAFVMLGINTMVLQDLLFLPWPIRFGLT